MYGTDAVAQTIFEEEIGEILFHPTLFLFSSILFCLLHVYSAKSFFIS